MADNADARARGAIERIFAQAKKRDTIKGFVGKPNGNGTYTIYTGYAPGWVYVRLTDAVDGSIAIAIAMNTNLDPAVEVEMERVDGMLVIKSAVPAQAARLYGNSTPQAQQPPAQQPPAGYTNKAGGELSLVTKDGTALGGRVVRITPYRHRGGWWPGTDTITLTPTSTSGQRAWVLVGINTKTNAITQALSTNRSVGFTPFPESDVDAVINAYPDVDWRAAVNLANGETSIDATDILDLTNRGETKPKSNYTATAAPGVGDDIDDGYGVGSMWIDTTNDNVYQCTDATAGAAVWAHLNAASSTLTTKGDVLTRTSSAETRLAVGTDGYVLTADSGEASGIKWAAPSGGSGSFTHSYVGYNTAGGSTETMTRYRQLMKKVTLASDGMIMNVAAHIKPSASANVMGFVVAVLSDNAGTPNEILSYVPWTNVYNALFDNSYSWVSIPVNVWCPAGDYWLAVMDVGNGSRLHIAYDGSGADKYYAVGYPWLSGADGGYTATATTNKYSIRASVLT